MVPKNRIITLSKFLISVLISISYVKSKTIPNLNIKLIDGSNTTIGELVKDGPLLIDFWATWCVPCKKVMKYLNEYHLEFKEKNFKVLMMNTDTPRSFGKVKSYINSLDYQFNVGLDPNKVIAKKLNGLVMPTLILIDKGGEIIWRHQGYLPGDEVEIKNQIIKLLDK